MNIFQLYGKEIVALFVPLITWGINRVFRARAKLQLANPHRFTFLVQQPLLDPQGNLVSPTQSVQTISYMLKNAGSESAKGIELVFNWKPQCLNVWPSRRLAEHIESDGRFVLTFDSLAPAEVIGFELLAVNGDVPALITARSEQCVAVSINMLPQPVAKPWQVKAVIALSLAGLGVVVYLALLVLQILILKTSL